ncbi:MAG: hypothetical protein L6R35_006832, partial [Caloplaca aegaea]
MYGASSKGRTRISNVGPHSRPQGKGEQEKNLWSSLLNGVASGKKLPEKNLLVLGGNAELQREFLETLESDTSRKPQDRRRKKPPVANEFALGYTYQDVLDADHDALVKPLLTAKTIPETLVVILLDWADPWSWARQLRDWTEKIESLERDHGWREEEFDFSLQYLRTALLKHGSSLIHTSLSVPNSLPTLIHSSLGIHSLLKRQTLKHNVIDRDKVLVPPNWDSWGKIRVLREGFDVEGISSGWSIDIQVPAKSQSSQPPEDDVLNALPAPSIQNPLHRVPSPKIPGSVLPIYEENIPNPYKDRPSTFPPIGEVPLDTTAPTMQDFLKTVQEQM